MWIETTLVTKKSSLMEVAALFSDYEEYGMVEEECEHGVALTFFTNINEEDCTEKRESILSDWLHVIKRRLEMNHLTDVLYTAKWMKDNDWNQSWKEYVTNFKILPHLWVHFMWDRSCQAEEVEDIIHIDTELSFGTGNHETTQSCAKLIALYGREARKILDIGTGTGLLLFIAEYVTKGAGSYVGVDLDVKAVEQAQKNALYNHSKAIFLEGDLDSVYEDQADLIIANLTVDPLKILLPSIIHKLVPHGILIISGIVEERLSEIRPYIHANYNIIEGIKKNNWYTFALRKKHETTIC